MSEDPRKPACDWYITRLTGFSSGVFPNNPARERTFRERLESSFEMAIGDNGVGQPIALAVDHGNQGPRTTFGSGRHRPIKVTQSPMLANKADPTTAHRFDNLMGATITPDGQVREHWEVTVGSTNPKKETHSAVLFENGQPTELAALPIDGLQTRIAEKATQALEAAGTRTASMSAQAIPSGTTPNGGAEVKKDGVR